MLKNFKELWKKAILLFNCCIFYSIGNNSMIIYTNVSKMLYSKGTIQYINLLSEKYCYKSTTLMSPYNKSETQSMEHAAFTAMPYMVK